MINQLYILLSFFIAGIIIGLLFDIFRVTRKSFKLPNFIIYIEDVLFWILAGLIIIATIFIFTDGQIRLYMFLMLFMGAFIYFALISKLFIKINVKLVKLIQTVIDFMLKPFKIILDSIKNLKKIKKFSKK